MIRVTLSLLAALGLCVAVAIAAPAAFAAAPGDLNDDGAVDAADVSIATGAVGTADGDAGFVAAADMDGDGVITLVDVSAVMDLSGQ